MKRIYLLTILILCGTITFSQQELILTDSLVKRFHKAWNEEDIPKMISLLDADAFFKSPFQLRYGRDTMVETVLTTNPAVFKVAKQVETHSHIEGNMAWSIGSMVCDVYDDGVLEDEPWYNDYLYVFTKERDEDWKLLMMIFHE